MNSESLYRELGQLIANTPQDLRGGLPISPETHRWLGRAAFLLAETIPSDDMHLYAEKLSFSSAVDHLGVDTLRQPNAHKIVTILHRALARAELNAPAAAQGAFIPVGAEFDTFQVISKVLSQAKNDVLIVDAYMGVNALTDFAPLAPAGVAVRLLTDSHRTKAETLQPAAIRWAQQYGTARPLEIRLTAPRLLHDRLIVLDGAQLWLLSQSLKDFVSRASATVTRVDEPEISEPKMYAHEVLWTNAQPL